LSFDVPGSTAFQSGRSSGSIEALERLRPRLAIVVANLAGRSNRTASAVRR
jgi:hypothetical protein